MELPQLTVLTDHYAIRRVLRRNPMAITYLGWSIDEEEQVLVQEYFPADLARRAESGQAVQAQQGAEELFAEGLRYFRTEASLLAEIEHPNLTTDRDFFEANGTGYRVADFDPGSQLSVALNEKSGRVTEETALRIMKPLLEALHAVHERGLLHGGISSESIFLTKSRRTLLIGFRSAQLQLARRRDRLAEVVLPGISPIEQYTPSGRQGPWTDVYTAAATLYQIITGRTLPEAPERRTEDPVPELLQNTEALSEGLQRTLMHALAVRPQDRIGSAEAFREILEDPATTAVPAAFQPETPAEKPAPAEEEQNLPAAPPAADEATGDEAASVPEETTATGAEEFTAEDETEEREDGTPAGEAKQEDRSAEAPKRSWQSAYKHAALLLGAGLVIVALGSSAIVLGSGLFGGEHTEQSEYAQLRAEGDSLFAVSNYSAARSRYVRALGLQEEGTDAHRYLNQRLEEIDRREAAEREERYREHMQLGERLEQEAETLQAQGQQEEAMDRFAQASEAYLTAWDTRPADSLAAARVQALNDLLMQQSGDEPEELPEPQQESAEPDMEMMREQLYTRYREQGDELVAEGKYQEARQKFREALDYRPEDEHVREQLVRLDSLLSRSEEEETFARYRERGDLLLEQGHYASARREYELALEVKPDEETARLIAQIDSLLAAEEETREQYQYHRARGDVFFEQERYEEAVRSYEEALIHLPEEAYAQQRLTEARQRLMEAREAEAQRQENMTENGAYVVVDQQPELIGGLAALHEEVRYPSEARQQGIEGRVIMQFVVETDGSVRDPQVVRGIGGGCDEEALRVLQTARFEPARLDGEPVPARHSLWIRFELD